MNIAKTWIDAGVIQRLFRRIRLQMLGLSKQTLTNIRKGKPRDAPCSPKPAKVTLARFYISPKLKPTGFMHGLSKQDVRIHSFA